MPMTEPHAADPPDRDRLTVVRLRGVSVGYDERAVVRDVDLTVRQGDVVAVLGANGSGKTTLMRGLLGLATVLAGEVEVLGDAIGSRRTRGRVGYVPQRQTVGGTIPSTVREVVASGRLPRRRLLGRRRAADREAVQQAIAAVDLETWADTDIAQLSGGQQRRALIARALASQPEVMIMDEPTAGVDLASQQALADSIRRLVERGVTLLVVTHEAGPLTDVFTRSVVVRDGRVVHDGPHDPTRARPSRSTGDEHARAQASAPHEADLHGDAHHLDDPADPEQAPSWLEHPIGER
jgi:zinc transport system ATP-binding protein